MFLVEGEVALALGLEIASQPIGIGADLDCYVAGGQVIFTWRPASPVTDR